MADVRPLRCSTCPVRFVYDDGWGGVQSRCALSCERTPALEHERGCWMVNTERAYVLLDFIARAAVTLDDALGRAVVSDA